MKKETHLVVAMFLHYALLPVILVGSDIFIGFLAHYSGTTGNIYTIEAITGYLGTLTIEQVAPWLIVAIVVVILVEIITRQHKKHLKR